VFECQSRCCVLYRLSFQRSSSYTSGVSKARAPGRTDSEFCAVALNICWSSAWNFLRVLFRAPRILRRFLDLCKICETLSSGAQISGGMSAWRIIFVWRCLTFFSSSTWNVFRIIFLAHRI